MMHFFLSGICSFKEMEAGGTELYTQGCHTLLVGVAESYAFHVVSFLLLTILVHSLAVITACAMARVKVSPCHHHIMVILCVRVTTPPCPDIEPPPPPGGGEMLG